MSCTYFSLLQNLPLLKKTVPLLLTSVDLVNLDLNGKVFTRIYKYYFLHDAYTMAQDII